MSAYDDCRCTDATADQAAAEALNAELVRQQVVITPQELGEHLAALTNEQFDQFCQLVIDTDDKVLQHMVRNVICVKLVDKRVKELMK